MDVSTNSVLHLFLKKILTASFQNMAQERAEDLGVALVDSVATDNLITAGASILDATATVAAEASMHIGSSIPVLGVVFSLYKAGITISQHAFTRKLAEFLTGLESIPLSKRQEFVRELAANPDLRQKVGNELVIILDRLNSVQKAGIFSRLLGFLIEKKLDYDMFTRLSAILDEVFLPDLLALKRESISEYDIGEPEFTRIEMEGLTRVGITRTLTLLLIESVQTALEVPSGETHLLRGGLTVVGKKFQQIMRQMQL